MANLQTLLEKKDSILVDASTKGNGVDIFDHMHYNDRKYIAVFDGEIRRLRITLNTLNAPCTRTMPDVAKEIAEYQKLVDGSYDYFAKKRETPKPFLDHLEQVKDLAEQLAKAAEDNSSSITHPAYTHLQQMITLLSQRLDLKIDTNYARGRKPDSEAYNSDTDEKLATTILWESGIEANCPSLLTNDRDFESLLSIIPWILGSKHFLPHNEGFRRNLKQNKFEVYKTNKEHVRRLTYPNYTFEYQNRPTFWLPNSFQQPSQRKTPIGPNLGDLTPRCPRETIEIQAQLYQHWEKIVQELAQ